jgi:hypothetical protein
MMEVSGKFKHLLNLESREAELTPLAGLWLNPRNDQCVEQPDSALTGGCGFRENPEESLKA